MKDDRLYLIHIMECVEHIESYAEGGREVFLSDAKTQDAILRRLQTLAESTQRLSDALKKARPGVDWRSIAAFRNVAVHGYLGIDLNRIWDIVKRDLPELKANIQAMLEETQPPGG